MTNCMHLGGFLCETTSGYMLKRAGVPGVLLRPGKCPQWPAMLPVGTRRQEVVSNPECAQEVSHLDRRGI